MTKADIKSGVKISKEQKRYQQDESCGLVLLFVRNETTSERTITLSHQSLEARRRCDNVHTSLLPTEVRRRHGSSAMMFLASQNKGSILLIDCELYLPNNNNNNKPKHQDPRHSCTHEICSLVFHSPCSSLGLYGAPTRQCVVLDEGECLVPRSCLFVDVVNER